MSADYLVSSLPPVPFDGPAPLSKEAFDDLCRRQLGDTVENAAKAAHAAWRDLQCEIRNTICEIRAKALGQEAGKWTRPAKGCSVYWRNRAAAAMQEKDVAKREEMLDRLFWDAAESLVPPSAPLSAAAAYAWGVKLEIARKRASRSAEEGSKVFDGLTNAAKIDL